MRAMVLNQPGRIDSSPLGLKDVPLPVPGRGQVRLQVRCCAICHTDLHIAEGDLPLPKVPIVPGHQIVGIVDATGPGVNVLKEGGRVGVPWLHSTCGHCDYCRRGMENLCDNAQFTGYHVDGGYAEHMLVQEAYAFPIPQALPDENAAPLLCAGVIGYRSYRLSDARSGPRLGLYGFGASAHLVLQLAKHEAREVYVFTRTQSHRELAKKLGAFWVGSAEDTAPHQLDSAIIFAPAGQLVPHALRALRKAGTLALAGITMSPVPQMDYSLLYHERTVRSVANSTRNDCREFLQLAAEIPLRTEVQIFGLEEANWALQALKKSMVNGAGVLQIAPH